VAVCWLKTAAVQPRRRVLVLSHEVHSASVTGQHHYLVKPPRKASSPQQLFAGQERASAQQAFVIGKTSGTLPT